MKTPAHDAGGSEDKEGEAPTDEAAAEVAEGGQEPPMSLVDLLGGEAAKRQAQERSEAQQAQQAAMNAIEAEAKKKVNITMKYIIA